MTAIVGNVPPDVIRQDRFTIGDWAARDTFRPLDDYITRDRDKPQGVREEDYYPACWKEANYTDPATGKKGIFAIPLYFVLANLASLIGFYKFLSGERYAKWEPIRDAKDNNSKSEIYHRTT